MATYQACTAEQHPKPVDLRSQLPYQPHVTILGVRGESVEKNRAVRTSLHCYTNSRMNLDIVLIISCTLYHYINQSLHFDAASITLSARSIIVALTPILIQKSSSSSTHSASIQASMLMPWATLSAKCVCYVSWITLHFLTKLYVTHTRTQLMWNVNKDENMRISLYFMSDANTSFQPSTKMYMCACNMHACADSDSVTSNL